MEETSKRNTIKVRQLGLAAYIKMKAIPTSADRTCFIGYEGSLYIFESDRTEDEWRIEYINSECSAFDNCLRELREFEKRYTRSK
jgi:hypothetical protein